jgi:hypothetical protein
MGRGFIDNNALSFEPQEVGALWFNQHHPPWLCVRGWHAERPCVLIIQGCISINNSHTHIAAQPVSWTAMLGVQCLMYKVCCMCVPAIQAAAVSAVCLGLQAKLGLYLCSV